MGITPAVAILISSVVAAGASVAATAMAKKPDSPEQAAQIADKTTAQLDDELDAPEIGDAESDRRKRQAAKDKFKVETTGTGLNLGQDTASTPGVQI